MGVKELLTLPTHFCFVFVVVVGGVVVVASVCNTDLYSVQHGKFYHLSGLQSLLIT